MLLKYLFRLINKMNKMKFTWIIVFMYFFLLGACKKPDASWAHGQLSGDKHLLTSMEVASGRDVEFSVERVGRHRLGLLVRQSEQLSSFDINNKFVYLRQVETNKYVGTHYSASEFFDINEGGVFCVENRTPILIDVVVYVVEEDKK